MKKRKEICRPGTYSYEHPKTGLPAKMVVTPEMNRHFHSQGNAMLAAGLSVPIPLEHQPDAKPMTAAERAAWNTRNNTGWVEKYEISDVLENGELVKDVLFGILDIQDESVAKRLPSTIKFTSPWINSFTDGSGKRWDGVISHVALTTRPRITKQQPFAHDMAAALSLIGSLSDIPLTAGNVGDGVSLSRAGLVCKDKAGHFAPKFPVAFSLYHGVKLSKEEVDEAVAKEEEADTEEEGEGGKVSPLDKVPEADTLADSGDVKIHEMIGHLLKALGFNPPDGMDETTFERDIYETLMAKVQEMGAKAAVDQNAPKEPDPVEEEKKTQQNPVIQESPSMYASMAEVNKITDPKERQLQGQLFSLQQENTRNKKLADASRKNILDEAKRKRDQRVEKIAARLPATKRDVLLSLVAEPSAMLSLNDDGVVVDPMAKTLEVWDEFAVDLRGQLSAASVQEQPADGQFTDKRRTEVVDEVLRNTGGVPANRL